MTVPTPRLPRLLIAAECFSDAQSAFRLVRPLQELFSAQLSGLLSSHEFAEYAVTAGQQIVSATGSFVDIPSPRHAHGIAAGEARAFRRALAEVADKDTRDWTFRSLSGELISEVCGLAAPEDVVLLGRRPICRSEGRVLLIGSDTSRRQSARALAERMALALMTAVREIEVRRGGNDVLRTVDRSHAALVVADFREGPLKKESELRALFEAARCPVVILGASEIRSSNDPGAAAEQGKE